MKRNLVIVGLFLAVFFLVCPAFARTLHVPQDYGTIQGAVNAAKSGDKIQVGFGNWVGAIIDKKLEIKGGNGAVIIDGPQFEGIFSGLQLVKGSDGATISHLQFEKIDGAGIIGYGINDVTVTQCTFVECGQGLLTFNVKGWKINHNEMRDPQFIIASIQPYVRGGGGINLISRYNSDECTGNVIEHNKIWGEARCRGCSPTDIPGNPYGITILRQPKPSQLPGRISQNFIIYNDVELVLGEDFPNSSAIPIGVQLADLQPSTPTTIRPTVSGNTIAYNDLRGTQVSIGTNVMLNQYDILGMNFISRNLGGPVARLISSSPVTYEYIDDYPGVGDNRGQGVTPASQFKP
jgi:hypothetical protein